MRMKLLMIGLTLASCNSATAPEQGCRDDAGAPLPTAPQSARVDLATPRFSNPTNVTNPLFPISALHRAILLGTSDGLPFRTETTLLPYTKRIEWNGVEIATLVSQYVAYVSGRIHEVALDWYAQADDGSVWYLGEDVFNYENGVVLETDGTWIAGEEFPGAMIMPASPQVGQVWRPENACPEVFEEVTVTAAGVTVTGPRGSVPGAIVVQELHMDGTLEDKTFAPGYGEFSTGAGANLEALALAVPTDALATPLPVQLQTLARRSAEIFAAAAAGDWTAASNAVDTITAAWTAYRAGGVPPLLDAQMTTALAALDAAVTANQPAAARQTSIAVAIAGLDFELRHRPRRDVDVDLLELWVRQLLVDMEANSQNDVLGDVATLRWIRDRLATDAIDEPLAELRREPSVAAAARLREALAGLRSASRSR